MYLLHRIGPRVSSNFNTMAEVLASTGPISFDGIYRSVYAYADDLHCKTDVTLFVMGNYIGGDNRFDRGETFATYCTWDENIEMCTKHGWKLGWHSWSHPDLTQLDDNAVRREIASPFRMDYFAYPHGRVDARVAKLVEEAGYKEAWAAGPHGDGSQFQRKRQYLNW